MNEQEKAWREYLSAKAKARWADPVFRAKQIEARKKSWMTPERRENHSKGQKRRWAKNG